MTTRTAKTAKGRLVELHVETPEYDHGILMGWSYYMLNTTMDAVKIFVPRREEDIEADLAARGHYMDRIHQARTAQLRS